MPTFFDKETIAFPELPWDDSKFESNSEKVAKQHRILLDEIGKILNIQTFEDWYSVTKEEFLRAKGQQAQGILNYHKNNHIRYVLSFHSIYRALMKLYPEYPWKIWKFERVTSGFWDDESNVRLSRDVNACNK